MENFCSSKENKEVLNLTRPGLPPQGNNPPAIWNDKHRIINTKKISSENETLQPINTKIIPNPNIISTSMVKEINKNINISSLINSKKTK